MGRRRAGVVEAVAGGGRVVVWAVGVGGVLGDGVHEGGPAELFRPGVPVVLQGIWRREDPPLLDALDRPAADGWHLRTDHMVVKHDNDYRAEGAELEPCGTAP